ncbi:MAG: S49 family peptidase [Daejeonella sp.]
MNGFKTISAILRGQWMIEATFVHTHLPLIHGIITGKASGAEFFNGSGEFEQPFAIKDGVKVDAYVQDRDTGRFIFNEANFPEGCAAVIPIIGPILKYDGSCGEAGSVKRSSWIHDFKQSNKVTGFVFYIDSPGGQADGTPQFSDLIRFIDKPKIAYVDGGAHSAGYWLASACDEIILSHEFTSVGSIGAYTTILDYRGYLEKQGYKVHEIYPDESSDKNIAYRNVLNNEYALAKQSIADLAKYFIKSVAINRGKKLTNDTWNTGKDFSANEAIEIGLADRIASFEDAIASVLSTKKTNNKNSSYTKNQTQDMKFPKVASLANRNSADVSSEELTLINTELTENGIVDHTIVPQSLINDAAEATSNLAAAEAQITALTAERDQANSSVSNFTGQVATLTARVTELETQLPGGAGKKAVSKGDTTEVKKVVEQKSWEKNANRKFSSTKE